MMHNTKTTDQLNALVRLCNESIVEPSRAACNAQAIRAGLLELIADPSAANAPRNKVQVISLPGKAAIKYHVDNPELPRLTAYVSSCGDNTQQECKIYIGNDVLAELTVYRSRSFAVRMVRQALKGAMSRLGKRRRLTANRQSREAAKKNNPVNPVNPV